MKYAYILTVAMVLALAFSACFGAFLAARIIVAEEASSIAMTTIIEAINQWGDVVTIDRKVVGSIEMCSTYDIQTRQDVGPWPLSEDGRCHLKDYVRRRVLGLIAR